MKKQVLSVISRATTTDIHLCKHDTNTFSTTFPTTGESAHMSVVPTMALMSMPVSASRTDVISYLSECKYKTSPYYFTVILCTNCATSIQISYRQVNSLKILWKTYGLSQSLVSTCGIKVTHHFTYCKKEYLNFKYKTSICKTWYSNVETMKHYLRPGFSYTCINQQLLWHLPVTDTITYFDHVNN